MECLDSEEYGLSPNVSFLVLHLILLLKKTCEKYARRICWNRHFQVSYRGIKSEKEANKWKDRIQKEVLLKDINYWYKKEETRLLEIIISKETDKPGEVYGPAFGKVVKFWRKVIDLTDKCMDKRKGMPTGTHDLNVSIAVFITLFRIVFGKRIKLFGPNITKTSSTRHQNG